jgi:hypothetical protein
MIWLTPHQITPPITALFDITQPTLPRAFNVLEDITGGQVVVDDLKSALVHLRRIAGVDSPPSPARISLRHVKPKVS